ncbi:hypothetical protein M6D93_16945 [Jatrophihabitans telluris]|uniref:HNH endonuclease n=1 Tax=Jatrophihabitans telluris TaxID=2038343 RepID=A0ABY4QWS8_9ACTN|nr:hypothetical protein [Jatrophihabitans telluris]UQX87970.1 hypothetical protein M6D93_16945 [Jatrophihabitans telluris]
MASLNEVGQTDGWRCWLCDESVEPDRSVNDDRGPSIDSFHVSKSSSAKDRKKARGGSGGERLAHRACNTKKGAVAPVIAWPGRLLVADPAPLFAVAERLERKGGREAVGRCPSKGDAEDAADWLVDRFSRLVPDLDVQAQIQPGGGQFLVVLESTRRR